MNVLRTSWWSLRLAWRAAPALVLAQLGAVVLDAAGPALQVILIDCLVDAGLRSGDRLTGAVVTVLIAAALVFGLNRAVNQVAMTTSQVLTRRVRQACETDLAHAMARATPAELMDAELASRARTAAESIRAYVSIQAPYVINSLRAVLSAVFLLIALAPYSVPAALLIALASLPVLGAYTKVAGIEEKGFPASSEHNRYAAYYLEQLTYERPASELAALGTGWKMADLAAGRIRGAADAFIRVMVDGAWWITGAGVVSALMLAGALALLVTTPAASAGTLAAGAVAILSGMAATSDAAYTTGVVISSTPAIAAYRDFVETRLGRAGRSGCDEGSVPAHPGRVDVLSGTGLTVTYPHGARPAVDGVSVTVRRGEMVGVVGANGAGKTTLVRLLMGVLTPDGGAVAVDDRPLTGLPEAERLALFGALSQEFGRYELTVRQAVELGTTESNVPDEQVWAALDAARLREAVEAMPEGLDTQLGAQFDGVGLSGGQWQRLALARISLRDAPIWVLDEPTSAVDAETEREILDDLGRDRADRITLVVSHRASSLRAMDRIVVLDRGHVVQEGTYAELLAAPGRFREIFAADAAETEMGMSE